MAAPSRDWVPIVLAIGLATALNLFSVAVLYDALFSDNAGISENATQILTGWGGGIVGILGAVFGYRAGAEGPPDAPAPGPSANPRAGHPRNGPGTSTSEPEPGAD